MLGHPQPLFSLPLQGMRRKQLLGKEPWFFCVPELKQKGNGKCRASDLCQKKDNLKYLIQALCRKLTGSDGEREGGVVVQPKP